MLRVSKTPFVFVGKKELVKIPVFGYFYKRVCILVDRSSVRSRTAVYKRAQRRLDQGLGICIFPEGGVPEPHIVLDRFKDGAFKMAIDHQIPVVPMTFFDSKKRLPFELTHGGPGRLRAQVHRFVDPPQPDQKDLEAFREGIRNTILEGLV
jgi:1-acyl-sn-glycerol-3-phosphate acyltransferase